MPKQWSANAWSAATWEASDWTSYGDNWSRSQRRRDPQEKSWKEQQEQAWNARVWAAPHKITISMACQCMDERAAERWCRWFAGRGPALASENPRAAKQCEVDFSENEITSAGLRRILETVASAGLSVAVLKIYKNRISGDAGLEELIRSGTVREIHASHNDLDSEAASALLLAAAEASDVDGSYCYPWWQDGGSQAPLWLRLERNVLDPTETMERVRQSLRGLRRKAEPFCMAKNRSCSTKVCAACHAGSMAAVHVPYLDKQRGYEEQEEVEVIEVAPVPQPAPARTGHRWGKLGPRESMETEPASAELRPSTSSYLDSEPRYRGAAEAYARRDSRRPSQASTIEEAHLPKGLLEQLEKPCSSDTSAGSEICSGSDVSGEESSLNPTVPEFVPASKAEPFLVPEAELAAFSAESALSPGWPERQRQGAGWAQAPTFYHSWLNTPPGNFTVPDPSEDFLLPECLRDDIEMPSQAAIPTLSAHAAEFVPCQQTHEVKPVVSDLREYEAGSILKAQASALPGAHHYGAQRHTGKVFPSRSGVSVAHLARHFAARDGSVPSFWAGA